MQCQAPLLHVRIVKPLTSQGFDLQKIIRRKGAKGQLATCLEARGRVGNKAERIIKPLHSIGADNQTMFSFEVDSFSVADGDLSIWQNALQGSCLLGA